MISLLKRTDALQNTINLKNTIVSFQNVMYPEDYDTYTNDELEIYDAHNLNEFEITKEADEYSNHISINYTDINSYTVKLAEKLIDLLQKIKTEQLYIISHLKLDFFGNLNNKYKPLANAYKELKKITNSNNYDEAFHITLNELPVLINIFSGQKGAIHLHLNMFFLQMLMTDLFFTYANMEMSILLNTARQF